jgi:hypothetical protein
MWSGESRATIASNGTGSADNDGNSPILVGFAEH